MNSKEIKEQIIAAGEKAVKQLIKVAKEDIIKFYGIHPDKIEVIYQSCNPIFYEKIEAEDRLQLSEDEGVENHRKLTKGSWDNKNFLIKAKDLTKVYKNGTIKIGQKFQIHSTGQTHIVDDIGIFSPKKISKKELSSKEACVDSVEF